MTVAELIEKLQEQPQDLPVVIEKGYMQDMELATSVSLREGHYYTQEVYTAFPRSFFAGSGEYVFVG